MHFFFFLFMFSAALVFADSNELLISNVIKDFMHDTQAPGVAVAFFDGEDGKLLNFGVANKQTGAAVDSATFFEIASITKVFTSTELALQVQRKQLNLTDFVINYIPALKESRGAFSQIRLVDLATHTSSLPRMPPPKKQAYSNAEAVAFLKRWQPSEPSGTKYSYSNLGFMILGFALGKNENKTFFEVIKSDLLDSLAMSSTMIQIPDELKNRYAQGYNSNGKPVIPYPKKSWPWGGALRSTGSDMLKFLIANLNVAGPSDIRSAMQFAQQGQFKVNDTLTLGLGWQRFTGKGKLLIDKNGGVDGFSSYIGMLPDKKIGIVLLANKGKTNITGIGRKILIQIANTNNKTTTRPTSH